METSSGGRRMKMGQGTQHCQLTVLPLALHTMLAHLSTVSPLDSMMQAATTLSSVTQKDYTTQHCSLSKEYNLYYIADFCLCALKFPASYKGITKYIRRWQLLFNLPQQNGHLHNMW